MSTRRLKPSLTSYGVPYRRLEAAATAAPPRRRRMERLAAEIGGPEAVRVRQLALVALQRQDGQWLSVRVPVAENPDRIGATIIVQTIVLYLVMLIPLVWLTRRIARSMGALRDGVAQFELTQEARPIAPTGPSDLADLTRSFNAMSARIASMLNEKDVMLGAIGHDLKTPLAALRVRVESVPDDRQRARMVDSIDDITRTLDDILSLARIGRTGEVPEPVNLGALVEMIADEFRDLGQDVEIADATAHRRAAAADLDQARAAQRHRQRGALWCARTGQHPARCGQRFDHHRRRRAGYRRQRDRADVRTVHPAGGIAQHGDRGHWPGAHTRTCCGAPTWRIADAGE